ncbi:hypothetical protein [Streptomyces incanus]|uniref:Uncharacterized protein n=1 Tax=Streptomyces incanus TaxID=887453 RepID=A0ABW0XX34_9ACTN
MPLKEVPELAALKAVAEKGGKVSSRRRGNVISTTDTRASGG